MHTKVLIVDDDIAFSDALSRALMKREFDVSVANSLEEVERMERLSQIKYAVVDLKIGHQSGLNAIEYLLNQNPLMKIVMLTAYASIATAVEAMKLGAVNYLTKPATVQEIIEKLIKGQSDTEVAIDETPLSVKRLEWEHLQRVLLEHNGNISAAARALNMHRRTLQRKLQKRPVKR